VRWVKLVLYLGLVYVVLSIALPRAGVWLRLLLGPAGWTPDPPNPLLWPVLTAAAGIFLVGLVADVGLGLWKVPRWANALLIVVFGVAITGYRAEQGDLLGRWHTASEVPPARQLSAELGRVQKGLADHYRRQGRFPGEVEALEAILAGSAGTVPQAPYLYAGLRRRPLGIRVQPDASGPIDSVPDGVLPGVLLYAVTTDGDAYWLTAVAGEGVPAEARILAGPDGRPAVISNVPAGWGRR
jgi:hypothetical protein